MSALARGLLPLALLGCARGEPFREPPLPPRRGVTESFASASQPLRPRAASPLAEAVPVRLGGDVRALQRSPDGARALALEADGIARLWDLSEPRERLRIPEVTRLHASPDGRSVVLARWSAGPLLVDLAAGALRARLGAGGEELEAVLFCGPYLALVYRDAPVGVWRWEDGRELFPRGSGAEARSRGYDRNGMFPRGVRAQCRGTVLVEYVSGTRREWDLATESPPTQGWRRLHDADRGMRMRSHEPPPAAPRVEEPHLTGPFFSSDTHLEGVSLQGGSWAVQHARREAPLLRGSSLPFDDAALLRPGAAPTRIAGRILGADLEERWLFTASADALHVYSAEGAELLRRPLFGTAVALRGLYEGNTLASLSADEGASARSWVLELASGAWLGSLTIPSSPYGTAWPSQWIYRSDPSRPWLWHHGGALYRMPGAEAQAALLPVWRTAVASRDGARACLLGGDGTARLVEVASGRVLRRLPGHAVVCAETRALTVEQGRARVWDLAAEAPLGSFAAPLFVARGVFLAEDARLLTVERVEEGRYLARVRDGRTGAPLWTQGELTNAGNVFVFDDARTVGLFTERDWVTSLTVVDAVTARTTLPPLASASTFYDSAGFAPVVLDNGFRCDAVSLRTGARLWTARAPCNELRWMPPHRMALAVHSSNYSVTAVDTRTGQTLATLRDEGRFPAQSASGAPWATLLRAAGVSEGEVSLRYAEHSEHAVVGLRGDTQQWLTGGSQVSAPAGLLLPLLGEDEHFVVLDPASGRLLDYAFGATAPSAQSEPLRPPTAAVLDEDRHALYLAQPGGALLSLDARTLRVRWRATLPAEVQALGALSEQGRSLLLRTEEGLYAVETERGAVRPLLEGGVFDLGQTLWLGARVLVATPAGGLLLDGR